MACPARSPRSSVRCPARARAGRCSAVSHRNPNHNPSLNPNLDPNPNLNSNPNPNPNPHPGVSSFGFCGVIAHAVVEAAAAVLATAQQVALPNPNPNPCPTPNPNPIPNQASSPLRFARRSYPWEPLLSGATAAAQQAAEEAAFFITCWAAQPARYPTP